ncbi:MAG: type IX secretion system membrane protein PorP/SprF [Bacteroidetes bacterium]|nr:MAG: type IX secretion system membrane protein PorP/SprF [Bacteroidota bacterium]
MIMKATKILTTMTMILGSIYGFAQDVHFSQMEMSSLNLNPALAGANAPMTGIVNYRTQWNSVATPFNTIAASYDARFNEGQFQKKGIIAGGINFYNDNAGDNRVSTTNVSVNLAYHLIMDNSHTLGLGIYGAYGQRAINANNGKWASQYDGTSYNSTIVPGETFNSSTFSYMDAGAGLLYTYRKGEGYMTQNNDQVINAGLAFYHVNAPSYGFIENSNEQLHMRISAFANGVISLSNSHGALVPGVYFNSQKSAREILYGMSYRYTISEGSKMTGRNKPTHLYFGLFNRWGDAVIPRFMFEWYTLTVGFAYDVNISKLTDASGARGGMEFSLKYTMETGGVSKAKIR